MNATSGKGFSTFNVSLANQPRNSIVGGARHIPIAKFSRGNTRGRDSGNKRGTSINFYQNGPASKIKNAIDISMNKFDGQSNNQSVMLNESLNQRGDHPASNIFIGSKPATGYGSNGANIYSTAQQPNVYSQHVVLQGPNQFEVLGVSTQKSISPQRFTESRQAGQRKGNNQMAFINAKKTMTNGFNKTNGGAGGNPNSTYHGSNKNKMWGGFYPKYQQ